MIYTLPWKGARIHAGVTGPWFPVQVPGNIQADYAAFAGLPEVQFGDNCKLFEAFEEDYWLYSAQIQCKPEPGQRVFFVTKGIEYEYDIRLNGKTLAHHEGMFSPLELDITEELEKGNALEVLIHPHPKREGADPCRDQADQSCKPAMEYNWDWAPRLLISGIWNETYIETRSPGHLSDCEVTYELSPDLRSAQVSFRAQGGPAVFSLYDPDGNLIYCGSEPDCTVTDLRLWWCLGHGEQALYTWKAEGPVNILTGRVGFRQVKLVMNGGAWDDPSEFPKSRSAPPITLQLNGRRIFAQGSNWVNPELFTGSLTREHYEKYLTLARDANMNILRCWGGAIIDKEPFFDLCDEMGILIWQEFPLACNNYKGTRKYLKVLEQEATAILLRLRRHPCVALWCGGNELFNNWSKMTDQSFALRLLNKLCYELDWNTPFLPTAPVMGMGHGHYNFLDFGSDETVFQIFRKSNCTAYSEFAVPSMADMESLKKAIPEEILRTPAPGTPWETHKGYGSWTQAGQDSWLCMTTMDAIFGPQPDLESYIEKSNWLQCEGLKCIFEEARRQWPHCSMALNWCLDEPWINVGGPTVTTYPGTPKPGYYALKDALRPVVASACMPKFRWYSGEMFQAELWMLNNSLSSVFDEVRVFLQIGGEKQPVLKWETGRVPEQSNRRGHLIQLRLPETDIQTEFKLILESLHGTSTYRLPLLPKKKLAYDPHALNV